jgi:hypothetical protein
VSDPNPRVSVCTPFFGPNPLFNTTAQMQRDIITHEFFHLIGLSDIPTIGNTRDAINDANTMAQVSWLPSVRVVWLRRSGNAQRWRTPKGRLPASKLNSSRAICVQLEWTTELV